MPVSTAYAESLGRAGRAAFEADFTENAVVARYLDFFDRVTKECAASPD